MFIGRIKLGSGRITKRFLQSILKEDRISARLQGGIVKAYYKKASKVTAGEVEDNIAGYEEITLDSTNLTGKAQNLEVGKESIK